MSNLLIYKKIPVYHNNLELKEIYTMRSKQVHNDLISQYFPGNIGISRHPGKYESFPLFCQPWKKPLYNKCIVPASTEYSGWFQY